MSIPEASALALAPKRDVEPVVMAGVRLYAWQGVENLHQIGLFRYEASSGTFVPIPFQIDKRRVVNLKFHINEPSSPAAGIDVCEYGYFREIGVSPGSPDDHFASDILQWTDEVVFMLFDAGVDQAPRTTWYPGTGIRLERYEIGLSDPITGAGRWVYAFLWDSGTPVKSTKSYVSWTPDPQTTACTAFGGANPCGVAFGVRGANGAPSSAILHRVHFGKNWVTDDYRVDATGSYLVDMIARFEYRMGSETEDTWSNDGDPRFRGVYLDSDGKPVRRVREIQGAQSGRHTSKQEFVYPTMFVTRVNLRVHPPSHAIDIKFRQDVTVATETPSPVIWTETGFLKTPKEFRDVIEGQGPEEEVIDPQTAIYRDWAEVATSLRGTYARFIRDLRQFPAAAIWFTYQDWSSTLRVGMFGNRWGDMGNTQDGAFPTDYPGCASGNCYINDGGCESNPEGHHLNFGRMEMVMFPEVSRAQPDNGNALVIVADDFRAILDHPVTLSARKQNRDTSDPPPIPICIPGLTAPNPGTGVVDLSVNTSGCSPSITGYRLYRALGAGDFRLLQDLGAALSFRDFAVSVGSTYRYAVSSYNEVNAESALSSALELTVTDTTPPAVPSGQIIQAADQRLTVRWNGGTERDISGYNVEMSGPGSGYELVNGSLLPAGGPTQWVQAGLPNGQTYCFRVSAVDQHGNVSAPSPEIFGVPGS